MYTETKIHAGQSRADASIDLLSIFPSFILNQNRRFEVPSFKITFPSVVILPTFTNGQW